MGMYSYISLRIWVHKEKRPANKDETHKIIQALYDDKESNSNQEAQYAFDLDGDWKNETKWYSFNQDITLFSQKYPQYSFIVQECGTGEFEDLYDFRAYFQGECYEYDQYFRLIDFIDFDSHTEDLFKPNFTLFKNIEELKNSVITLEDQGFIKSYIPTIEQPQSDRVHRILFYQASEKFSDFGFDVWDNFDRFPSNSPIKPAVEVRYYLGNLKDNQTAQDFINAFFKVSEQYLIGELR